MQEFAIYAQRRVPDGGQVYRVSQATAVFFVVDGHPVHRSTKVKKFVVGTEWRLRQFHLPTYLPDLNLDGDI